MAKQRAALKPDTNGLFATDDDASLLSLARKGYTPEEIARMTGVSLNVVRRVVARKKKK